MIKRWNLVFLGLLLISVFFMGCTSQKSAENVSNPGSVLSFSPSGLSVPATVSSLSTIKTRETPEKSRYFDLAQNETAYHRINTNVSYELSLGEITFQQDETNSNKSSYTTKINMTVKNSGKDPIKLIIAVGSLMDKSGDGCAYAMPNWCDVIDLDQVNPGESKNFTANVTFLSTKKYDYLSSQRFSFDIEIESNSKTVAGSQRNMWWIDLKKTP